MDNLKEKDLIIRDLYVVNSYYKNKSQYDKMLQQKHIRIDKSEVEILDKKCVVSSENEIIDTFVLNGTKFNDDFGKNRPLSFCLNPPLEQPETTKTITGFILLGTLFGWLPGIPCMIIGFSGIASPLAGIFGLIIFVAGIASFIAGIRMAVRNKRIKKANREFEKERKEKNQLAMEWEKSQARIKKERYNNVRTVYESELDKCFKDYHSNVEKYNKIKDEHILQIQQITDEINTLKRNSIVPIFYLDNESAVEKMLFFMLNKRADTVKELVNLYETTIWQDAVLRQLYLTNKNLIEQNLLHINGLLKIDDSINRVVYDMEHLEFETLSFGVII